MEEPKTISLLYQQRTLTQPISLELQIQPYLLGLTTEYSVYKLIEYYEYPQTP